MTRQDSRRLGIAPLPSRMDNNPYGRMLYEHLSRRGLDRVDGARLDLGWLLRARRAVCFLHFHWDEHHYDSRARRRRLRTLLSWLKLAGFATRLAFARALGLRIVWTIHEVTPRESRSPRRDRVAARLLGRASHLLIAHDVATADRARDVIGDGAAIEVVPHGSYIGAYPPGRPRAAVRSELGIDERSFVFLCFGHLRAYKRLDLLLEAFSGVRTADAALVVAGEVAWRVRDEAWERETIEGLRRAAAADSRIKLALGFVPAERVAELHAACDAAVLPRGDGWTSGSLVLALSHGLPVVAARTPAYEEMLGGEDAGWLFSPGSAASMRESLVAASGDPERARAKGRAARSRAERLDWDQVAGRTATLLRQAASR